MYFDVSPDSASIVYSTCKYYQDPHNVALSGRNTSSYRYDISVVNVDGTENMSLTESESVDILPVWSPDGTQIAFVSDRDLGNSRIAGRLVIYTVATGESRDVPLTIGDRVGPVPPVWSPDGRRIAFVAHEEREIDHFGRSITRDVYAVGIDGSGLTKVWKAYNRPAWSPDGSRIALLAPDSDGDGVALFSFAADGSDPVRIVGVLTDAELKEVDWPLASTLWNGGVSWSPDGSEILLDSLALRVVMGGSGTVESLPVSFNKALSSQATDGAAVPSPRHPRIAAWSPDGSRIAVAVAASIHEYIDVFLHTISRDGTDPQALVRKGVTLVAVPAKRDHDAGVNACSAGYVVSEPKNNPGLVDDCKTLLRAKDELGGGVALNWGPGVPIEEWTGITVESIDGPSQTPVRRVTRLIIRWPSWPNPLRQDYFLRLKGSIPRELAGLGELIVLDLRRNRLGGRIPDTLAGLENLRGLHLGGNYFEGCIPAELQKTFGTTLSNGVGLPYCE